MFLVHKTESQRKTMWPMQVSIIASGSIESEPTELGQDGPVLLQNLSKGSMEVPQKGMHDGG